MCQILIVITLQQKISITQSKRLKSKSHDCTDKYQHNKHMLPTELQ